MYDRNAEKLLGRFLACEGHEQILAQMDTVPPIHLLNEATPEGFLIRTSIVGRTFELLAFESLKQVVKKPQILLSPDETFGVYERLHPYESSTNNQGFNRGIPGNTIADGLILEESGRYYSLVGIAEYKAGVINYEKFYTQISSYLWLRNLEKDLDLRDPKGKQRLGFSLHELRPSINPYPVRLNPSYTLTIVVPDQSPALKKLEEKKLSDLRYQRVIVVTTDFNGSDLASFIILLCRESLATRQITETTYSIPSLPRVS